MSSQKKLAQGQIKKLNQTRATMKKKQKHLHNQTFISNSEDKNIIVQIKGDRSLKEIKIKDSSDLKNCLVSIIEAFNECINKVEKTTSDLFKSANQEVKQYEDPDKSDKLRQDQENLNSREFVINGENKGQSIKVVMYGNRNIKDIELDPSINQDLSSDQIGRFIVRNIKQGLSEIQFATNVIYDQNDANQEKKV